MPDPENTETGTAEAPGGNQTETNTEGGQTAEPENLLNPDFGKKDEGGDDKAKESDDKTGEEGAGKGKAGEEGEEEQGAPDEYEAFSLPEGLTGNAESEAEFKTLAKELDLTQQQAQKLVDFEAKQVLKRDTDNADAWKETIDGWVKASKTDAEIGGDKFEASQAKVNAVVSEFGSPELVQAMSITGVQNHPEFLRMMVKIKDAMADDTTESGSASEQGEGKTGAQIMYPNMK